MILLNQYLIITASLALPLSRSTTTLAVRYRDGVVVGADTRTSVGAYVGNRYAAKIDFILDENLDVFVVPPTEVQFRSPLYQSNNGSKGEQYVKDSSMVRNQGMKPVSTCCVCRSGSAADTQNLINTVRHKLLSRKILHASRSTVVHAAHLLREHAINNSGMKASLICAGYDHVLGRGVIYSIDLGGVLVEHLGWTCSGSGSSYILGFMDGTFPKDDEDSLKWTESDAVEYVSKAIELAISRDGSSGGFVRIFVMNQHGKMKVIRSPNIAY